MPTDFPHSPQIHILKEETSKSKKAFNALSTEKTYLADIIREQHKDTYQRWTVEMDDELTVMYCEGVNIKDLPGYKYLNGLLLYHSPNTNESTDLAIHRLKSKSLINISHLRCHL